MQRSYDFRNFILREFELRKNRNAQYSLRAYARDLGLHAPKLSQILKGTCGLSAARGSQIAEHLNLSPEERKVFLYCLEAKFSRSALVQKRAQKNLEVCLDQVHMALEQFRLISDWFHFAILEFLKIEDSDGSTKSIEDRFGLDRRTVTSTLERLQGLGLIDHKEGSWKPTNQTISTPADIPSRDVREHHRQVLQKSITALETVDVQERDFSTMMMAIREDQLAEAKAFINEFKDQFDLKFGKARSPTRVYALGIQLFPLDQKQKKKQNHSQRSQK